MSSKLFGLLKHEDFSTRGISASEVSPVLPGGLTIVGAGAMMLSVEEDLEKLVRELGEAINRAIDNSDEVEEVMARLREAGHDVMLVLEATVAFRMKSGSLDQQNAGSAASQEISIEDRLAEISHEDRQFLKSLNIRFD
jgi:hypothetical protein